MLGLTTSEDSKDFWRKNMRRAVFQSHPNGAAPLCAILSMMDTDDPTPLTKITWAEERIEQLKAVTIAGPTANTVFYNTGTTTGAGATVTVTNGTTYRIYLQSAQDKFGPNDVFRLQKMPIAAGGKVSGQFVVVSNGTNFVEAKYVGPTTAAITNNAAAVVGLVAIHQGSSHAEGGNSANNGNSYYPIVVGNNTQIFKDSFELTRHALKAPLEYNQGSDYERQLKRAGIKHMAGIEESFLFGEMTETLSADPDSPNSQVRTTTMGGLAFFLRQWEKGNVTNGGLYNYRPGGIDLTAQTDFLAYPDKRIINLNDGSIAMDAFEELESLPFRKVNSQSTEKLCLCGHGYMSKLNARFRKEFVNYKSPSEAFDKWNYKLICRETPTGTIYYKTHPLFNSPDHQMYNGAFYLDIGFIKMLPFIDQDTEVQEGIQLPGKDKRKDQYMTEVTGEFVFPEAHMMVQDLGGISQ